MRTLNKIAIINIISSIGLILFLVFFYKDSFYDSKGVYYSLIIFLIGVQILNFILIYKDSGRPILKPKFIKPDKVVLVIKVVFVYFFLRELKEISFLEFRLLFILVMVFILSYLIIEFISYPKVSK
jgi:hypothetical protein